ncbi:MAG: hypothetical protein GY772_21035 [bacterium]|nr:hypothetical protein [bacterium]
MAGAPQATLPAQDGQAQAAVAPALLQLELSRAEAQAAVAPALLQLELSHAEAAVHAGVQAGFDQGVMQLLQEQVDQKRRKLEELRPKEARAAAAERLRDRLKLNLEKDAERLAKANAALGLAEGKLLETSKQLEKAEAALQDLVKVEEPSPSTPVDELLAMLRAPQAPDQLAQAVATAKTAMEQFTPTDMTEDEAVTETGGGPEAGACAGGEVDEMQGVQEEEQAQNKQKVLRAFVEKPGLSEDEAKAALSAVEEFKRRRCGRSASSTGRQPSGSLGQ